MKRGLIKKIFKVIGIVILVVLSVLIYLVYSFTSPKSDEEIVEKFEDSSFKPTISYKIFKDKRVRVVSMQEAPDTILPTLLFVHGSPGSAMDFQRYLKDSTLNSIANLMSYDRVGYGPDHTGEVLGSLNEEVELLHQILGSYSASKVILVGYSYGGTTVMASDKAYRKKIILAASVRGDLEPMFWAMNLYKWRFSRALIPKVFRGASLEKLRHVEELPAYEPIWVKSPSSVLSIHGRKDFIVPYENSTYLEALFNSNRFKLIPIEEGNHSLIWTNFETIKSNIVKSIQE